MCLWGDLHAAMSSGKMCLIIVTPPTRLPTAIAQKFLGIVADFPDEKAGISKATPSASNPKPIIMTSQRARSTRRTFFQRRLRFLPDFGDW
jgi:hypothetical protein